MEAAMRVADLLRRKKNDVVTIEPDSSVATAARLLMGHGIGGLPVVAGDGRLAGFLAERDIVQAVDQNGGSVAGLSVERLMRRPAPSCGAAEPLYDVMARMTRDRLRHLVVVDGDRITGVLSVGDIVKHRLEQLETETGVLRDYVGGQRAVR
jgi:CBS domain-containing protein